MFCHVKNFTYFCEVFKNELNSMKSYMPKIEKLSQDITPFGGISYINAEFNRCGLAQLIDSELGNRVKTTGYTYSEIFRTWSDIIFCGGDCAEDVQIHLRKSLEQIPNNAVPGPDVLLRGIKELAADNTGVVSESGNIYQFNINDKMNGLNIKSLLLTGELESGKSYDFDYDNQIISHGKYDAKRTYKHNTGYFPGVATIGNKIIYVENRDGNANVKIAQAETLKRAYKTVKDHGMSIKRSRMDAGSYSKEIIDAVSQNSELFYIRANRCMSLTERIAQIDKDAWQTIEINYKEYQVTSLPFTQFFEDRNYRLVIMREKSKDAQLDLFTGDSFIYRSILTNDRESSEKAVIEYYNARGGSEKIFDIRNNDFGWRHLPCSDMKHNTVYLILTAMIKNFYNYIAGKVSAVFTDIFPTTRLKRFIFRFISVPARWYYRGRQWILGLYTDRPYEKIFV